MGGRAARAARRSGQRLNTRGTLGRQGELAGRWPTRPAIGLLETLVEREGRASCATIWLARTTFAVSPGAARDLAGRWLTTAGDRAARDAGGAARAAQLSGPRVQAPRRTLEQQGELAAALRTSPGDRAARDAGGAGGRRGCATIWPRNNLRGSRWAARGPEGGDGDFGRRSGCSRRWVAGGPGRAAQRSDWSVQQSRDRAAAAKGLGGYRDYGRASSCAKRWCSWRAGRAAQRSWPAPTTTAEERSDCRDLVGAIADYGRRSGCSRRCGAGGPAGAAGTAGRNLRRESRGPSPAHELDGAIADYSRSIELVPTTQCNGCAVPQGPAVRRRSGIDSQTARLREARSDYERAASLIPTTERRRSTCWSWRLLWTSSGRR